MSTKAASFGLAAVLAMLLGAPASAAEAGGNVSTEHHRVLPAPPAGEKLGEVHFPISCNSDAQKRFDRAVAILHSMWYEEAVRAFTGVAAADPACAMAWWGVAMSHWYPLWYPPPPPALEAGAAAVAKAEAIGAKTERERGYIAAIATFYRNSDTLDHRTRALAYEHAMASLHQQFPATAKPPSSTRWPWMRPRFPPTKLTPIRGKRRRFWNRSSPSNQTIRAWRTT